MCSPTRKNTSIQKRVCPHPQGRTEASLVVEKWNVPANEEQLRDRWATVLAAHCCLASSASLFLEVQVMGRAAFHSTF